MPREQNYATHRRLVPAYHGLAFLCLAVCFGWSVWHAVQQPAVSSVMQVLLVLGVLLIFWYARAFVLTVQDRLIRLEERLRMERVLPPDLHGRIPDFSLDQLIALRFAADAELPVLARRVLDESLQDREAIKRLISQWRPDLLRA